MAKKLEYLVIHCTATRAGHSVGIDDIFRWHMGPMPVLNPQTRRPTGEVIYKGRRYPNRAALPDEYIGGVLISQLTGRGWDRPGYRLMVDLGGMSRSLIAGVNDNDIVEPGEITWGARGVNDRAHHIVYVGGLSINGRLAEDTRTEAQNATLLAIVKWYIEKVPTIQIMGHNQVDNKSCPSFFVPTWATENGISEVNIYQPDPFGYRQILT